MQQGIKIVSFEEAAKVIKTGDRVHLHSVALAPHKFIKAMCDRGRNGEFYDVAIQHLHTEGPAPYADTEFEGIFNLESLFVGANVRKQTQAGYADYIPVFLSETQKMIRDGVLDVNVAVVQVSPPDKHGYVSLGTSIDCSLAAVETADTVVAIINKNVPRAFGDAMIPMSMCDIFCEDNSPLVEHGSAPLSDIEIAIGKNVAGIIPDGACLQMGIGGIPNAVLAQLGNHKNLGIHTEMFADGLLPLVESGVVNGMNKKLDKGKIVASFLMGTKELYDFVDDNPSVLMMDVGYTNGVEIIRQNPKVCAINSALSIDITGQVCADSIGTRHYSGVGGQIDFTRGAAASEGGVPVIAMPSVTGKGVSKIAPTLLQGSGVVTTRNNMHWFATEYGCVNLYGKTLQQRAKAIISIAHPNFREELDQAAFERFGSHYHFVNKFGK
ncbi:acetyl-CoA hydrolase/transferase family protein [Ancylomarina sp. 16SWW S1-10-2]|uniref:acetyl-CoA hydrolase/transferase family protein n=1 Tax=Ancylomarina sp. 16SWW S1-10-2 TaxID=2499681 RepID=UPI0012AEA363|nr:acetyl-CoA hydrolase/transferase C-terminal domain-containing protein [Ancylomarina sp. 16SWW S1-10-2]MRT91687.1 acetyl-CoA hydrolase/transferase family protein [Ancylomarina sp. 16SWW S1-10-2]